MNFNCTAYANARASAHQPCAIVGIDDGSSVVDLHFLVFFTAFTASAKTVSAGSGCSIFVTWHWSVKTEVQNVHIRELNDEVALVRLLVQPSGRYTLVSASKSLGEIGPLPLLRVVCID